jgi:hypothetical protein
LEAKERGNLVPAKSMRKRSFMKALISNACGFTVRFRANHLVPALSPYSGHEAYRDLGLPEQQHPVRTERGPTNMKPMKLRELLKASVATLALVLLFGSAARADDDQQTTDTPKTTCPVKVDTDNGKGGTQARVCDDNTATVGVSGPMKDVSMHTPCGGYNGACQVVGRAGQSAVSGIGHRIEDLAHGIDKILFGGGGEGAPPPGRSLRTPGGAFKG